MADFDLFKSALDAGMNFTEMTRQRAEAIVRDLTRTSEVNRDQAARQVEELVERSRKNTEALLAIIRKEIDERLANLATRDDLNRLASRLGVDLSATATRARTAAKKAASAAKKARAAAKKAPAKRAPAKKAAGKAPAKKAPAKKAPAKKAPAKKAAGARKTAGPATPAPPAHPAE